MKHITSRLTGLLLFSFISLTAAPSTTTVPGSAGDTIKIMTTPGLSPLVQSWVKDYSAKYTEAAFSVTVSGNNIIAPANSLGFLPAESQTLQGNANGWKLVVAHDAVVPVFNSKNPIRSEIVARGISPAAFGKILKGSGKILWSEIIPGGPEKPVNMYFPDNASIGKSVAAFTGADVTASLSIKTVDGEKFIDAISNDIWSVGFCRLNDFHLPGISAIPSEIAILPVDRNGNGKIDNFEKIYDNPETLIRGAWTGKYPRSLCGSIYAVSVIKPENKNTLAFLRWVISEGDHLLPSAGFIQLAGIEKESGLTALADSNINVVQPAADQVSYSWLAILVILIISGGIITAVLGSRRRKSAIGSAETEREIPLLSEKTITAPGGLYFDKSHTWAFMERDGLVRIGIDDFLQHVTGTITGIRLRETGEFVKRGEKILTIIRDGKQLSLSAPVSGIIRSQNTDLYLDSSIINSSPYTDGWVYLVEPKNWIREIQMMFVTEMFREWITDEFMRLKDFLATTLKSHYPAYTQVVLQDGGELTDNLLEKLGPEVWEDFQINFIDKSR